MKKPSLRGEKNYKYLEHFSKDCYLQRGHNDSGKIAYQTGPAPKLDPRKTKQFEMGFKGATATGVSDSDRKKLADMDYSSQDSY
jgi:hypothetical protein